MAEHHKLRVPVFCPQCSFVMKGTRSNVTYYQYDCCVNCFIEFIETREQRWKDGWRPSPEQLEAFKAQRSGNA